jgi:hypothetical protein
MVREYIRLTSAKKNQVFEFSNFRDVSVEQELDDVSASMSFSTSADSDISKIIQKYDYFEYYIMPDDSTKFICQFRGYVDKKLKRKSKTSRTITWQCLDKMSRFNRVNMEFAISVDNLKYLIQSITQQANKKLPGFVSFDLRLDGSELIIKDLEPSTNILEYFRSIREKAVLYVYYEPISNKVVITTPLFLQYRYRGKGFPVYEFDSENNMLGTFDYGDVSSDINAVIYYGMAGVKGIAVDFANYGANNQIRPLYRYDFSTGSKEELEKKARNELLDILRNYSMQFSVPVNAASLNIQIGSMCTINDHDEFKGDRFFTISKKTLTMNKGDMILTLTVRAGTITSFPEKMVLDNYGITDIDTLEVNAKTKGDLK